MPQEVAFKALGFGLIWFSFLLVILISVLSLAKDYYTGMPFRHVVNFAIAIIDLCAFIGLGMIFATAKKAQPPSISFDRS
jgi:hypothetical protein